MTCHREDAEAPAGGLVHSEQRLCLLVVTRSCPVIPGQCYGALVASPRNDSMKFTGLTQNLDQLYGSYRNFPVKLLGKLANFGSTL